jgi:hypothetical protein
VDTRLESFLKAHGIEPASLAKKSGYCRQHLLRIRLGEQEPTRPCIKAISIACRQRVKATDLLALRYRRWVGQAGPAVA